MTGFTHDQLVDKAILALREAIEDRNSTGRPLQPTLALRFALAFLYVGGDREPFDTLWASALNRIARLHGIEHW